MRSAPDGGEGGVPAEDAIVEISDAGLVLPCFSVDPSGIWHWLECNPAGQWGWIQEETGLPIADAIADELMATA